MPECGVLSLYVAREGKLPDFKKIGWTPTLRLARGENANGARARRQVAEIKFDSIVLRPFFLNRKFYIGNILILR